jgi:hypothetical protein
MTYLPGAGGTGSDLTASIPAALLAQPVAASLFVEVVDMDGNVFARSPALGFTVFQPCSGLCISVLSPSTVVAGSGEVTLTVTGTGFIGGHHFRSWAFWAPPGGAAVRELPTTVNSATELTAVVPEALLASPGTARVFVQNYDPMDDYPGTQSNALGFTISQAGVNP